MASEMIDPMSTSPYSANGLPGGPTSSAATSGAWRDPSNWMMPMMMLSAATSGLGKKKGGGSGMDMMMPFMLMQMMQGKKPEQSYDPRQYSQPQMPFVITQPQAAPSSGGGGLLEALAAMSMFGGRGQSPTPQAPAPTTQPVAPTSQPTYRNPSMW